MNILLGLFLIAHGLIHISYLTPKPQDPKYPFHFYRGWFFKLVGPAVKPIGKTLVIITVIALSLAGLAILGVPGLAGLWKTLTVTGAAVSLTVLILYWHPWLIAGIVIDIVLLYGLLQFGWTLR